MKKLPRLEHIDLGLIGVTLALAAYGFIMMSSASVDYAAKNMGDPYYYMYRQAIFIGIALLVAIGVFFISIETWYKYSGLALLGAFVLLTAVLIPGIGREVNGSMRWIPLGPINLQSSEPAKFFVLVYLSSYLVRRKREIREKLFNFIKPMVVLILLTTLLLWEPDFGSAFVMIVACMGMIFLGGLGLAQVFSLIVATILAVVCMTIFSPYRLQRFNCFIDPWAQPYDCGYQLIQSLIAFGRGEWFGLGLGNSIQKLFYLPEAHTDFVFAIIAEELGFVGSLFTLCLFALLVIKIFKLGMKARAQEKLFQAYLAYGIALVIAAQVFINIGVNSGLLPTKGLTLPLLSYGGSSLITVFAMISVLVRMDYEMNCRYAISVEQNERGRKTA